MLNQEKPELQISLINNNCMPYVKDNQIFLKARTHKLISISQHQAVEIPLGLEINCQEGYELLIKPTSKLITKSLSVHMIEVNKEVTAVVHNMSNEPYHIHPFDLIAQLVIRPVLIPNINYVSRIQEGE